ncbi:MAG: glycerol-3-phosphate 1-O-acyltransferase PlsY [Proteobacteria bacterium]|nr:glycerol-3-phosphate 1-O-acyltransferase PlsY [Pseudomonadota bacterium]
MSLLISLLIAYLLGSIPFGLLIGRFWLGVDVRQQGSGNIGMTNVLRVGGKLPGALTFILDFGKAWLAVVIAGLLLVEESRPEPAFGTLMLVGAFAILGHVFPVFLRFKGGKGISCQIGTLLAVYYPLALVGMGTWLLMFAWKKISSLSAIVMLCLLPAVSLVLPGMMTEMPTWDLTAIQAALSLLLIYCHRDNLRRLREGSEGILQSPSSNNSSQRSQ